MDKLYKLKYKGKWMKPIHMTGTNIYKLFDNPDDVEPMEKLRILAARALVSEDNGINIDDIEIVEV